MNFDRMIFNLTGRRIFTGGLICLLLALTLSSARAGEDEAGTVPTSETQAQVKLTPLREGTLPVAVPALGKIGNLRQAPAALVALSAGIVNKILVRDGQQVSSGTVLLRLDPRAAQAGLLKAQSDLTLAKHELEYSEATGLTQQQEELDLAAHQTRVKAEQAQRESDRLAQLLAKRLVSEKAATEARQEAETTRHEADAAAKKAEVYKKSGKTLDLDRLRAKVIEAEAAVRLSEIESEAMTVKSPLAGQVTRVHVATGQTVEKGAALVDLVASQGVGVSFALAPAQARAIKPAMQFELNDEAAAQTWSGKILSVGAGVDSDSGLVRVEGVLSLKDAAAPYLGEILPGEIITGMSPRGLIVPESALSVEDEGTFIHQIDGNKKAHKTQVKVVTLSQNSALVRADGLKPGVPVVIDGNYNLPDGAGVVEEGQAKAEDEKDKADEKAKPAEKEKNEDEKAKPAEKGKSEVEKKAAEPEQSRPKTVKGKVVGEKAAHE